MVIAVSSCTQYKIIPLPPFIEDEKPPVGAGPTGIFAEGYGTKEAPYQISSAADLKALAENISNGTLDKPYHYKLSDNITIDDSNWTPIGSTTATSDGKITGTPFIGRFDGGSHTITIKANITGNSNAAVGIFGTVSGIDTVLQNFTIDGKLETDSDYAGLVAGILTGGASIDKVTTAKSASIESSGDAAGFVGRIYGSGIIKNSTNNATVTATGGRAGGFINLAKFPDTEGSIKLSNLTNNGDITGTVGGTGGIAGLLAGVVAEKLYNTGDISGEGGVAGLIGGIEDGASINGAENKGDVKLNSNNSRHYGGIVGRISGKKDVSITNAKNDGTFSLGSESTGLSYIGGIVGSTYSPTTISESTNNAEINFPTADSIGGILGAKEDTGGNIYKLVIESSHNNASITGRNGIGGIAGAISHAQITNSGNESNVTISGSKQIGGIVGRLFGNEASSIENSANTASIAIQEGATSTEKIGGIVGSIDQGSLKINNSDNSGIFNFTNNPNDASNYGGIIGYAKKANVEITKSNNKSELEASTTNNMGGIIGNFEGTSADAKNNLTISDLSNEEGIKGTRAIGGIAGSIAFATVNFKDAKNSGNIEGNQSVGGVIGTIHTSSGNIAESTNSGNIKATENSNNTGFGGFIGTLGSNNANFTISSCSSTGNLQNITNMVHAGAFVGQRGTTNNTNVSFISCTVTNDALPSGIGFHGTYTENNITYTECKLNGVAVV